MTATIAIPSTGYLDGLPAEIYHQLPSLSSSGARDLLPPSTPARFRYRRDHPITPTREMELGTCVHTRVLGAGPCYDMPEFEDWRSKAAQERVAQIRARGDIPLKPSEYQQLCGMADAVRAHPLAGPLLDLATGLPERALFWRDEKTGVDCRGLVDFSPHNRASLVDLKTCADASPAALPRHMARYGYDTQAGWYLRGARALGLADDETEFVWVFVERDPPHLVNVVRLPPVDLQYAEERCATACRIYAECAEADTWPGYGDGITTITLPGWSRRDHDSIEEHTW